MQLNLNLSLGRWTKGSPRYKEPLSTSGISNIQVEPASQNKYSPSWKTSRKSPTSKSCATSQSSAWSAPVGWKKWLGKSPQAAPSSADVADLDDLIGVPPTMSASSAPSRQKRPLPLDTPGRPPADLSGNWVDISMQEPSLNPVKGRPKAKARGHSTDQRVVPEKWGIAGSSDETPGASTWPRPKLSHAEFTVKEEESDLPPLRGEKQQKSEYENDSLAKPHISKGNGGASKEMDLSSLQVQANSVEAKNFTGFKQKFLKRVENIQHDLEGTNELPQQDREDKKVWMGASARNSTSVVSAIDGYRFDKETVSKHNRIEEEDEKSPRSPGVQVNAKETQCGDQKEEEGSQTETQEVCDENNKMGMEPEKEEDTNSTNEDGDSEKADVFEAPEELQETLRPETLKKKGVSEELQETPKKKQKWTSMPLRQHENNKLASLRFPFKRSFGQKVYESEKFNPDPTPNENAAYSREVNLESISGGSFRDTLLAFSAHRSKKLYNAVEDITTEMKELVVETALIDHVSENIQEMQDDESDPEDGVSAIRGASNLSLASTCSSSSEEEVDDNFPDIFQVTGIYVREANGVYFKQTDTFHGKVVYRKQGSAYTCRWQDRRGSIREEMAAAGDAVGWVFGLFNSNQPWVVLRGRKDVGYPGLVKEWERETDDGDWIHDTDVKMLLVGEIPDSLYIYDGGPGELGGSFVRDDDWNGRPSYRRELDSGDIVVIRWHLGSRCWYVDSEGLRDVAKGDARKEEDVMSPTEGEILWERWNYDSFEFDERIACQVGEMPLLQVFISNGPSPGIEGIYDLQSVFHEKQPVYAKETNYDWTIRWHGDSNRWIIDDRGMPCPSDCWGVVSSADRILCNPESSSIWEVAQQKEDEPWIQEWVHCPGVEITSVKDSPDVLLVTGVDQLQDAWGLYNKERQKQNKRVVYTKTTGIWKLIWKKEDGGSWNLQGGKYDGCARAKSDVAHPAMVFRGAWESKVSGQDDFVQEPNCIINEPPPPPRMLFLNGILDTHPLYGCYLMRFAKNGRPSFSKETIPGIDHDRGTIYWEHMRQSWVVTSFPEADTLYRAELFEDIPFPCMAARSGWILIDDGVVGDYKDDGSLIPFPRHSKQKQQQKESKGEEKFHSAPDSKSRPEAEDTTSKSAKRFQSQFQAEDTNSDEEEDGEESLNESYTAVSEELGITCQPGDQMPESIFLHGFSHEFDGVFFNYDEVHQSRHLYRKQTGKTSIRWNINTQRWLISCRDLPDEFFPPDDEFDEDPGDLCCRDDVPHPALARTGWTRCEEQIVTQEMVDQWAADQMQAYEEEQDPEDMNEPDDLEEPSSRRTSEAKTEVAPSEQVSELEANEQPSRRTSNASAKKEPSEPTSPKTPGRRMSNASSRKEPSEPTSPKTPGRRISNASSKKEPSEPTSPKTPTQIEEEESPPKGPFVGDTIHVWVHEPNATISAVPGNPSRVCVFGASGPLKDMNGVYYLATAMMNNDLSGRALYQTETYEGATPWTLRYMVDPPSWIIERVPQLKGRRTKFQSAVIKATDTFSFARVCYDAPHPALTQGKWQIRGNQCWEEDQFITCRLVKPPPEKIFLLGSEKHHREINGTYYLQKAEWDGLPCWQKDDGSEHCVRWHLASKRWIADTMGLRKSKEGEFSIQCSCPDPLEASGCWDRWQRATETSKAGWVTDELICCYEGEIPPLQVYASGGPPVGCSGVYSFVFQQLHQGKFLYEKINSGWGIRWHTEAGRWVINDISDDGEDDVDGIAYLEMDLPHPAETDLAWEMPKGLETKKSVAMALRNAAIAGGSKLDSKGGSKKIQDVFVQPVLAPPDELEITSRDAFNAQMAGIYFLQEEEYKSRCWYAKQASSWALYWNQTAAKWQIDERGIKETGRANAVAACDVPNPGQVYVPWTINENRTWVADEFVVCKACELPPKKIFLFGSPAAETGSSMANGVYILETDTREMRPFYRKELSTNGIAIYIRYCPAEARWLVDNRKGAEFQTDDVGLVSVLCDAWHPAAVNRAWEVRSHLNSTAPKNVRGSLPIDTKARGSLGSIESFTKSRGSLPSVGSSSASRSSLGTASRSSLGTNASAATMPSTLKRGSASASMSSASIRSSLSLGQPSKGNTGKRKSTDSKASTAPNPKTLSQLDSDSSLPGGRPSLSGGPDLEQRSGSKERERSGSMARPESQQSVARMSQLGSERPESRQSKGGESAISFGEGSCMSGASELLSASALFGNLDLAPRMKRGSAPVMIHKPLWSVARSLSCVPVSNPPKEVYVTGIQQGSGAYKLDDTIDHEGRPAYLSTHSKSKFAIRWHPDSRSWVLGEFVHRRTVSYPYLRPANDVKVSGGEWDPVIVTWIEPGGPADKAGVQVGHELSRVTEGSKVKTDFHQDPAAEMLKRLDTPCILEFSTPDYSTDPNGIARLAVDAPHPAAYPGPWQVMDEDEDWYELEKPVACRIIVCPPASVQALGHEGKPREINGKFKLQDYLHEGRPYYQREGTPWRIQWNPRKQQWAIELEATASKATSSSQKEDGKNEKEQDRSVARAKCNAPHPAAASNSGGFWEMSKPTPKRSLQVVPDGNPIDHSELSDIVQRSLLWALNEAQDRSLLMKAGNKVKCLDTERVIFIARSLEQGIVEAQIVRLPEDFIASVHPVLRRLNGWLLLEDLTRIVRDGITEIPKWTELLALIQKRVVHDEADPNVIDDIGWTPLHFVMRHGLNENWTREAVSILLEGNAELDTENHSGACPVLLAAAAGKRENVRGLLRVLVKRADGLPLEDMTEDAAGKEFLKEAQNGDLTDIRAFVLSGSVSPNFQGTDGKGAIHFGATRNQAAMCDWLVKESADVNLQDNDGNTALHYAAIANGYVTIMVLLRQGASPIIRNEDGCTPYMLALERYREQAINEFRKHMVSWEEIEVIVGKERTDVLTNSGWRNCVRNKVRRLLQLGFDDEFANPMGPRKQGKEDRLQFANQLVAADPNPTYSGIENRVSSCLCLESRGRLLCKELLLPLLKLTSECQLVLPDFVKYKDFCRYLLHTGIAVFSGIEIAFAVQSGIESLDKFYSDENEKIQQKAKSLTMHEMDFHGAGSQWPGWHHGFAHGPLDWLSFDGTQRSMSRALAALVDVDVFSSVQKLCAYLIGDEEEQSAAPPISNLRGKKEDPDVEDEDNDEDLSRTFSTSLETRKPQRESSKVNEAQDPNWNAKTNDAFWQSCYTRWLYGCALRLNAKVQTLAMNKWGTRCKNAEAKSLKLIVERKEEFRQKCVDLFGQIVPKGTPHIFEAGCVPDFVRFSITCDTVEDMTKTFEEMSDLSLENDGLEVVSVHNKFFEGTSDRSYKDVRVGVLAELSGGTVHIAEVQLIIKKYLQIRLHRHLLSTYENGEYVDANYKMRTGCAKRVGNAPKDKGSKRKLAAGSGDDKVRFEVMNCLWCWADRKTLGSEGHLSEPDGAENIRTGLTWWKEVKADGRMEKADGDDIARLKNTCDPKMPKIDGPTLGYLLQGENIILDMAEMERLQLEIHGGEARLFRNQEGFLHVLRDRITMRVLGRGGDDVLWREGPTDIGLPNLVRRHHEEIDGAARRLVSVLLPPCLRAPESLSLCDFDPDSCCWLTYDDKGIGSLPAVTRHFVFKALLGDEIDPFALVQLGLNE